MRMTNQGHNHVTYVPTMCESGNKHSPVGVIVGFPALPGGRRKRVKRDRNLHKKPQHNSTLLDFYVYN
jgi:hypothetical protein